MSYRPDNQSVEDPCNTIIRGCEDLQAVISEREDADDWKDEHIAELQSLSDDMRALVRKVKKLRKDTW